MALLHNFVSIAAVQQVMIRNLRTSIDRTYWLTVEFQNKIYTTRHNIYYNPEDFGLKFDNSITQQLRNNSNVISRFPEIRSFKPCFGGVFHLFFFFN